MSNLEQTLSIIKPDAVERNLSVEIIPEDSYWLDAGTPESLMKASNFIYELEQNKGVKTSCPEEISIYKNWIEPDDFAL